MSKQKLVKFALVESGDDSIRTVTGGIAVVVTTTLFTGTPAEVTQAELRAWVEAHAVQDDGEWKIHDNDEIGPVGPWPASDKEGLVSEVAATLNKFGVSVSDWSPYSWRTDRCQ